MVLKAANVFRNILVCFTVTTARLVVAMHVVGLIGHFGALFLTCGNIRETSNPENSLSYRNAYLMDILYSISVRWKSQKFDSKFDLARIRDTRKPLAFGSREPGCD